MRTPLFQSNQKLFANIPSELTNQEANVLNVFRNEMLGASCMFCHQQNTPNLTVYVQPSNHTIVNGVSISFGGGSSPSFTPPATGTRTDLLSIDASGMFHITQGVTSFDDYPEGEIALCEVHLLSTTSEITDNLIKDVRPFLGSLSLPMEKYVTVSLGEEAVDYPLNTTFLLTSGSYSLGNNALDVYVDGIRKELGAGKDYVELSSTSIKFNSKIDDTQSVVIVANSGSALDLHNKVSKSGDTMTGALTLPKLNLGSSSIYIDFYNGDLRFRDSNNITPVTLSQLFSDFQNIGVSLLPSTNNSIDLGSATNKFRDGYFEGKLTVVGGIDPAYLQLTPLSSEPSSSVENKLWVDLNRNLYWKKATESKKLVDEDGAKSNDFKIGNGVEEDIFIRFNTGANSPYFRWRSEDGVIKFSFDGITEGVLGMGGNVTVQQDSQTVHDVEKVVFNLPFSYAIGTNKLEVYTNGQRNFVGEDYEETSDTSITFLSNRKIGDKIVFRSIS